MRMYYISRYRSICLRNESNSTRDAYAACNLLSVFNRFYCTSLHAHRLVQTEEIPFLSGSRKALFSPAVVEMNATMLLRFLQQNCSRESGTYLLHRAKGGGPVQLYDLQVLCLQYYCCKCYI
jgi:hypothetical protein